VSRVGLVVVAHSARLAEGVVEVVTQMAPDVVVVAAGGLAAGGGIGTDFDATSAALDRADGGAGVVLLYDLGSAKMTAELAVEMLGDPSRAIVVDAPLVEGAVAAAVAAQGGADVDAVAAAAVAAFAQTRPPADAAPAPPGVERGAQRGAEFVLTNEIGLHARPAALLARGVVDLDVAVTVRLGERLADASSVLALMGLGARRGDRIVVTARGVDADEAVRRIGDLVARDFDEADGETA